MSWSYTKVLDLLKKSQNYKKVKKGLIGIERECLRVNDHAQISKLEHPKVFGSSLSNPVISTEFAEAQLELITPTFSSLGSLENYLTDLHQFIEGGLKNEYIWPLSMPAKLPKKADQIKIASYGNSIPGQKRSVYNKGLSKRYDIKMQTTSGVHFNYSFTSELWELLHQNFAEEEDFQSFITENYFALIRNFNRYQWLLTFLFGASPTIDKSFLKKRNKNLKKLNSETYFAPYATSLRMSIIGIGYNIGEHEEILYNNLSEYLDKINQYLHDNNPNFEKIGLRKDGIQLQLSTSTLQTEDEHFASIRPKQLLTKNESLLKSLKKRGVAYVEVRSIDCDPYSVNGIDKDQIRFLKLFLAYCLLKPSKEFSKEDLIEARENQEKVALFGRKEGLILNKSGKEKSLEKYAKYLLKDMQKLAKIFDKEKKVNHYQKNIEQQLEKVSNPELTPSAKILKDMIKNNDTHLSFGLKLAVEHLKSLALKSPNEKSYNNFKMLAEASLLKTKKLEDQAKYFLPGFEDMEISTQLLIDEALKKSIEVEVVDRQANFISLKQGYKREFVTQATKTDLDSYMTYLVMENKDVSKKILEDLGLNTPRGKSYADIFEAIHDYSLFSDYKIVVKPKTTNHGLGIKFVDQDSKKDYIKALTDAFELDSSVIVEEYVQGEEFRFLIVNKAVVAVCKRVPANIIGDGENTVAELVKQKNENPNSNKIPEYQIRLNSEELFCLKEEGLTVDSIPEEGRQVFLRKNSNITTGGDPIDVTDEVDKSYKKIAIAAAKVADSNICGLDMIIKNVKEKAGKDNYSVLELNFNPSLFIHEFPYQGKPRKTQKAVLKALGF